LLSSSLKPEKADQEGNGTDKEDGEESQSDDEETMKLVDRKISMNRVNVVGTDFEKYNNLKPTTAIKLRIHNLFMEYENSLDKEHAAAEFLEICQSSRTEKFMVVGYILNNAFSQAQSGWERISSLVVDHFYGSEKLFEGKDLVEG
jgi:hypothetical protein